MIAKFTFEDFVAFYKDKRYLPLNISCSKKHLLNEKELQTKYKQYEKKLEKNLTSKQLSYQDEWEVCREKVYKRDNNSCRLWVVLSDKEKAIARKNGYLSKGLSAKPTPAHFVARSRNSKLICDVNNVYTLSLQFHNRLDSFRDPITNDYIGKENVLKLWWKRIVPEKIYNKYKEKF